MELKTGKVFRNWWLKSNWRTRIARRQASHDVKHRTTSSIARRQASHDVKHRTTSSIARRHASHDVKHRTTSSIARRQASHDVKHLKKSFQLSQQKVGVKWKGIWKKIYIIYKNIRCCWIKFCGNTQIVANLLREYPSLWI